MVKNKKIIYGIIIILVLCALSAVLWNNSQVQEQKSINTQAKSIPKTSETSEKCGIEQCHGLDITCGSNVPEICNSMYAIEDGCRQFAKCQVTDGRCELAKNPKFDSCKSCMEKCKTASKNDPVEFSVCADNCGK